MRMNATYAAGLGAAMMFLLDPVRGRHRRAWLRDKCARACRKAERAYRTTRRDLRNRAKGVWAQASGLFRRSNTSDRVLLERVRASIGRVVSEPQAVEVQVGHGRVVLAGTVLAGEVESLLSAVQRVPGIEGVESRLMAEGQSGPEIDSRKHRTETKRGGQFELLQNHWSPTARLMVSFGGCLLAIYGLKHRGIVGSTLGLTGTALLLRGSTNRPYHQFFRRAA